jgi:hypothetical protein
MIVLASSGNCTWPWSRSGELAETVFAQTHPSLYQYFKPLQDRLMARQDKGQYWWELRSCDYYNAFDTPKVVYGEITWRSQFAYSTDPLYFLNTSYVLPTNDLFVLAVLNSPLMWAYLWRNAQHGKDEALRLLGSFMMSLPIAEPTPALRTEIEDRVAALLALTAESRNQQHELLNWLRLEFGVEKLGQPLENFAHLSSDALVAEVRKRRPKTAPRLTPSAITELTHTHAHYAGPAQHREAERRILEQRLSGLVNQAYSLSDAEIELLWRTAPPRMPGGQG